MTQQTQVRNPFMLMINPELVLAAMAKSERLEQLNRHMCRPLDRPTTGGGDESGSDRDDFAAADEPNGQR